MKNLRIFYTSDIHGFFSNTDYANGKTHASGLVSCMAGFEKDGNTLIIDGGDTLQGSPFTNYLFSQRSDGERICADVMNLAGYDFVTLGNHDFNYGRETLERFISSLDAVCLCANIKGVKGVEETAVVTLENGLRVGLTGITSHFVTEWEKKENLEGITVLDAFSAAKTALEKLHGEKVDITLCIYHGGYENDLSTGRLLSDSGENQGYRICKELDFDFLLCAHQHISVEGRYIGKTFTCQPSDKARQYIELEAKVDECGKVSTVSKTPEAAEMPHKKAIEYLAGHEKNTAQWLDVKVGHLDIPLIPASHIDMAVNGSMLANFFNQVQLEASGADISSTCLANSVKGFDSEVSIRDIVSSYVFPNTLITLEVNREVLKKALERCAEYFTLENGEIRVSDSFLRPGQQHYNYDYFSGIEYVFDISRPLGERVVSIKHRGVELSDDRRLTMCLNNYRASGAGGYECFRECKVLRTQPTEITDMIIEYVSAHKTITVDKTKWIKIIK